MEGHALESSQVDELMYVLQEAPLVVLLRLALAPKLIWNNLRQYGLAKGYDA